jgi:hypothetical protein
MLPLALNPHVRQYHERRNIIVKFVLKKYIEIEFVFVSYVLVVPNDSLYQSNARSIPDNFCL